jgi:hypothetical protein
MSFARRIRLFIIGILIGSLVVWGFLFRGRTFPAWTPEGRVLEALQEHPIRITSEARCMLNCNKISDDDILALIADGVVLFSESDIRGKDIPEYVVEGKGKNQVNTDVNAFPYLNNHAFIRELHVYGRTNRVDNTNKVDIQHRGLGKKLVAKAEEIARSHGFEKMAIISGVGVREYYRKLGYQLEGAYMTKRISYYSTISNVVVTVSLIYIIAFMIYFYLYTSEFDHVFNTIYSFIS